MYEPIAIIGYGVLYPPNSDTVDKFWENIKSGTEGIREVSDEVWDKKYYYDSNKKVSDKTYCKNSGYIDNTGNLSDYFSIFNLDSIKISSLNRTKKMVLYTILQAMVEAKIKLTDIQDSSLIIGNMLGDLDICDYILFKYGEKYFDEIKSEYFENCDELSTLKSEFEDELRKKLDIENLDGMFPSSLISDITKILGINNTSFIVDGACSGSLIAIDEAIKLLQNNETNMCIVTGVLGNMGVTGNIAFSKIGGLSHSKSKPLDVDNDGLTPGEGSGTIIIKLLKEAVKDNDTILGVISGSGVASDGSGQSIYAPSTTGQYLAMKKSLKRANLDITDIDYIEMHATGTPVGDDVELESIVKLCKEADLSHKIKVGSLKSQIGHSFSAAGMANLIKVLKSMESKQYPPTYNFNQLSEKSSKIVENYLTVNVDFLPWKARDEAPRRALINAFGFGGINGNILVEEYITDYHTCKPNLLVDGDTNFSIVGIGIVDENQKNFDECKHDNISNENFIFPFIKFKIPPKILNKIDYSQQIALIAATKAIGDNLAEIDKNKVGVYIGASMGLENAYYSDIRIRSVEYTNALKEALKKNSRNLSNNILNNAELNFKNKFESIEEDSLPGFMDNIIASRISNYHNIQGCNAVYDAGVNSFSTALNQGVLSLINGENDFIVVGGVNGNTMPEYKQVFIKQNHDTMKEDKIKDGACFFVIKRDNDVVPSDEILGRFTKKKSKPITLSIKKNNYLGASGAFEMLSRIKCNPNNLLQEIINDEGSRISVLRLTKNTLYSIVEDTLTKEKIKYLSNDKSELSIVYKDIEDLKRKIKLTKKVIF
ncbi:hypothetical protein GCM10025878_00680 [Leuconostoc gasicomitatum]|uniref:Polyketide synthase of type I n=2 Tax=Leuconostoc TaxID=1243 RepID=A0AAN2QWP1_9LACO|nr:MULTISPECIES: beta-ketoacyl synthase N-terminal-like domain-containing protein [Leuconostoc]MBZ5956708.1 beta-ketoacyl synthase [Leuconostoc gasicomitatum]MBZ5959117.1 beta-ketoacyl synthase [Leuconostoc gasicomitatum]MBZ5965587.1 beta-ketoacyl synthase [Leuconostoc gasicomitatum]MBZ5982530.1 beta-ketoacyl synthase [Leuconostoc gasicomitatum]CBL92478.1 Multi-domain beta-ketoacyl synthase [Leuconostoc gasicomitatum LMG 18811]